MKQIIRLFFLFVSLVIFPAQAGGGANKDIAVQSCFNFHNTDRNFVAPDTSTLVSAQKKIVAVKRVGPRQMVNITIRSKNEHGIYTSRALQCLM
jgi:hypothetical protein